ncbi:hypothetical protein ACH5RR_021501 [Cinchona calisaya]|uniref:Uncharacterized protein n=1 Tax=Cinchona calisaya TaxID=153742 RepID=A0ABD2ZLA3_9GENT
MLQPIRDDHNTLFRAKSKLPLKEKEIVDTLSDSNEVIRKPSSLREMQFNFHVFLYQLNKKMAEQRPIVDEDGFQPVRRGWRKQYALMRAILMSQSTHIVQEFSLPVHHD